MENYIVKVDRDTLVVDECMEEAYGVIKVFDIKTSKLVGLFQVITSEYLNEDEFIKHYENTNAEEWMTKPYLLAQHKIIKDLHNEHMQSSNSNIYGDDLREWMNTEKAYGLTWDEYIEWLQNHARNNKDFENVFIEDDCETFWMGWDFLSNYNLIEKEEIKIDWREIALNLLSLAETLEDFGEHEDLRDRLKKDCYLTEDQLDKIGV